MFQVHTPDFFNVNYVFVFCYFCIVAKRIFYKLRSIMTIEAGIIN